jgi:hypothetical protein
VPSHAGANLHPNRFLTVAIAKIVRHGVKQLDFSRRISWDWWIEVFPHLIYASTKPSQYKSMVIFLPPPPLLLSGIQIGGGRADGGAGGGSRVRIYKLSEGFFATGHRGSQEWGCDRWWVATHQCSEVAGAPLDRGWLTSDREEAVCWWRRRRGAEVQEEVKTRWGLLLPLGDPSQW